MSLSLPSLTDGSRPSVPALHDLPPGELLQRAVKHHNAGRLLEAELCYRRILEDHAGQSDALHLLGVIAYQHGRLEESLPLLHEAIRHKGDEAAYYSNLGLVLRDLGRLDEAAASLERAVSLQPGFAEAHNNLGTVHRSQGDLPAAIAGYRRALELRRDYAEAAKNLAVALSDQGDDEASIEACRRVLAMEPKNLDIQLRLGLALRKLGEAEQAVEAFQGAIASSPNHVPAHKLLGAAFEDAGDLSSAESAYSRALELDPADSEAASRLGPILWKQKRFEDAAEVLRAAVERDPANPRLRSDLGLALRDRGSHDEAIACFQEAIRIKPKNVAAYNRLGNTYLAADRYDEAISAFHKAIRLKPDFWESYNNLAVGYRYMSQRLDSAVRYLRNAQKLKPDYANAYWNEALLLLELGDYERGWERYEWRFQRDNAKQRPFEEPRWDGSDLAGRSLMLFAEQGFGDTLMFVRYLSPVLERAGAGAGAGAGARAGNVILEAQPGLRRLLAEAFPKVRVVARGKPLPGFDLQCPLLSLPRMFETRLDSIPATVPYIACDREMARRWKTELGGVTGLKVGLVWAGSPDHQLDRHRSIALPALLPLLEVGGTEWFSLQVGPRSADLQAQEATGIRDLAPEIEDFADTAAVLMNLDLVITVDTSVAHLAGALGRPVWVLVPYAPDWRWMLRREDSPWYPTMRLFRQPAVGDWESPIAALRSELDRLVKGDRSRLEPTPWKGPPAQSP